MDIAIVGRHTKVSEDLRQKIFEKMEKIETLAPRATRADVHVVHERNPKHGNERERVEITVRGGRVVRAEASAEDRMIALDAAIQKLVEQLRKLHERKVHRHQGKTGLHSVPPAPEPAEGDERVASVEAWEGAPEGSHREIPIDGTPIVIRSKTHAAPPMTVADALDHMELVGHDFFLFHDADTGLASAVYRRRGWTYGVIHLEQSDAGVQAEEAERESA
ncbi:ribosome hibernation-promoting factor, HPF/YfiA family [Demequina lignilytica]|uniref:Ribosome hibernation promoting factor n=1 Tax=Demequina lignilytica TaxID=3051663 RepID=A0AAW7M8B3_9MICO|nr:MULTISPECIES: ribosome-associated translation inhibitor RaiA [unclassified Demequina]MDN4478282.1 ribosome-associated translation inhibitor RaiA [Demequina sp. SYSU T00039-1]MDN4482642.1 ribosome-associated translation inhibitor RaiA [Demequina sp. SYSU T0a273]MDN4488268.1 ribosome-associated translation inhibitor RaiA [Demequina sp. SYSU T00039]MDN4490185.1 ribosome-associated translation inhibitor RaiA [Demequina sp. SYSU T00068]